MSFNNFLLFLQQLLTMVDAKNSYSVAMAKNVLQSTVDLAVLSGKADFRTVNAMNMSIHLFDHLAEHAKEYAGKPGDYKGNEQKRRRLELSIVPHC